jgi:hypothetical protein
MKHVVVVTSVVARSVQGDLVAHAVVAMLARGSLFEFSRCALCLLWRQHM